MNVATVWERPLHATSRGAGASIRAARARGADRRAVLATVFGVTIVVGVALLLVWVRLQTVRTGYQLSAARHLVHKLEEEQRALKIEITTLTSRPRLEALARERLGMRPPAPGQIVSVP
ncbi:MAG: cell division protein FtsL [Polyangiaceae bacterium UTPRO1]|jgi:cell division protein FtsL|nr:cell division protein FtsL [Myxococcales bacterium]OQY66719.1 MAG: cell division protein FtsL [Polyangiaceae bacterium UTPRO1]